MPTLNELSFDQLKHRVKREASRRVKFMAGWYNFNEIEPHFAPDFALSLAMKNMPVMSVHDGRRNMAKSQDWVNAINATVDTWPEDEASLLAQCFPEVDYAANMHPDTKAWLETQSEGREEDASLAP